MYAKQISYTKLLPCFEIIPHYWINIIWHNAWKPTLTSVCGLLSKLWTNYLLSLWVLHLQMPTAVLQNQVFSTPKFLNSSGSPGSSRAILMGCPMWAISGPILALHIPYLPISAGETSILISAECQKEVAGEWEGEMERRMKGGRSPDKAAENQGRGSRGAWPQCAGKRNFIFI